MTWMEHACAVLLNLLLIHQRELRADRQSSIILFSDLSFVLPLPHRNGYLGGLHHFNRLYEHGHPQPIFLWYYSATIAFSHWGDSVIEPYHILGRHLTGSIYSQRSIRHSRSLGNGHPRDTGKQHLKRSPHHICWRESVPHRPCYNHVNLSTNLQFSDFNYRFVSKLYVY